VHQGARRRIVFEPQHVTYLVCHRCLELLNGCLVAGKLDPARAGSAPHTGVIADRSAPLIFAANFRGVLDSNHRDVRA
jgi:hypothetical protein